MKFFAAICRSMTFGFVKLTTPKKGFAFIELLVVMAIAAMLAAIVFPVFAQRLPANSPVSVESTPTDAGAPVLPFPSTAAVAGSRGPINEALVAKPARKGEATLKKWDFIRGKAFRLHTESGGLTQAHPTLPRHPQGRSDLPE